MYGGNQPHLPYDMQYVSDMYVAELTGDSVVSGVYMMIFTGDG